MVTADEKADPSLLVARLTLANESWGRRDRDIVIESLGWHGEDGNYSKFQKYNQID